MNKSEVEKELNKLMKRLRKEGHTYWNVCRCWVINPFFKKVKIDLIEDE